MAGKRLGMGRYIRPLLIILIAFLIVGSCNGSGGNSTTTRTIGPEGGTIRSSDGRLTLIIPAGALDEDTEISIKRINRDDLPPEFADILTERQYELGPDGIVFNIPIEVEFETDLDAEDPDGTIGADLSILLTSLDGELELLGDQQTIVDADENSVIETGTLEHFSSLVRIDPFKLGFENFRIEAEIRNVPKIIALNTIFRVDASLRLVPVGALLSVFSIQDVIGTYQDNSTLDIIPADEISIEALINSEGEKLLAENSFDYLCNSTEETSGRFEAIMRLSFTIQSQLTFKERTLVEKEVVLGQRIVCPAVVEQPTPPPPSPSPPPPPPPTEPPEMPTFGATDIAGMWKWTCDVDMEVFPHLTPNLGNPFSFDADITVNPDTLETTIQPVPNIFSLNGTLMPFQTEGFLFNGNGEGFLTENPGPNDANIIIDAENWTFTQDVPGAFSGDNEPGDIFGHGILRSNFEILPLEPQSSTADCVGKKTGE